MVRLFELLDDVGAGRLFEDGLGRTYLHKYCRSVLRKRTLEWLQQNRVPGLLFGVKLVAHAEEPERGSALRNTNPSQSVQAKKARAVVQEVKEATQVGVDDSVEQCGKRSRDDVDESLPTARRPRRQTAVGEGQTLMSEIVPGVFLDQSGVRARLRTFLAAQDHRAIVSDVKPIRHPHFFKAKAVCRGSATKACPVRWIATYYRQEHGVPAKTLVVVQYGTHEHVGSGHDSGRIFSPLQEAAARRFLTTPGKHTGSAFTAFLLAQGFAESSLPASGKRSRWLLNHKNPRDAVEAGAVAAAPRRETMERSLQSWLEREGVRLSDLVVRPAPARVISPERVCIAFSCEGMLRVLGRVQSSRLALAVDVKQGCIQHGWGIATVSLLVKDELRNTSLGRDAAGRRVQGEAWTSHALPVMQAIVNAETVANFEDIFRSLCHAWGTLNVDKPSLHEVVRQVHKDFAPAIEEARRRVFPFSRPVNDFFHLTEKRKTIEAKLQRTVAVKGKFVKEDFEWVMLSLHVLRRLPTVDLYSALWQGVLDKLAARGEEVAVEYLGYGGHSAYTEKVSVGALRATYNIQSVSDDPEATLLFSSHWSGITGIMRGTDCGDQALEAFHSPWQTQLDVLGKNVASEKVLEVMQQLYLQWETQCKWQADKPVYSQPPKPDPSWLNGSVLDGVKRSNAICLWDASEKQQLHIVVDADEHLQIVAMAQRATQPWNPEAAAAGCEMLRAAGDRLHELLVKHGLLTAVQEKGMSCMATSLAAVRRVFADVAYVFVSAAGRDYMGLGSGLACTCAECCQHGGCEHCEYVAMLDLRLRAKTSFPDRLPRQRPRGRPQGAHTRGSCRVRPE